MNAKLRAMPHDDYKEKQRLTVWLNSELLSFDIAVKCPNTGLPCSINLQHGWKETAGLFRLRPFGDNTRRTFNSGDLFALTLVPRPLSKTRFDRWVERLDKEKTEGPQLS